MQTYIYIDIHIIVVLYVFLKQRHAIMILIYGHIRIFVCMYVCMYGRCERITTNNTSTIILTNYSYNCSSSSRRTLIIYHTVQYSTVQYSFASLKQKKDGALSYLFIYITLLAIVLCISINFNYLAGHHRNQCNIQSRNLTYNGT